MVKESTLVNLLDNYVSGSRLDCAEAIYMWARGIPNEYASSALRIRYGNGMVYNEVIRDLKKIKVGKPIDRTEDTKFRIDRIIFEFFEEKCLPLILDRMVDGFKAIMVKTKITQRCVDIIKLFSAYRDIIYNLFIIMFFTFYSRCAHHQSSYWSV